MADVTQAAESSPAAATQTPAVEPFRVPTDPESYAEWRQTGKITPEPSKKEASAPSKSADDKSGNRAPVSETGEKQRQERPERTNANTRISELLAERDELRTRLEALEAGKNVKAASSPAPAINAKAESSPAPEEALKRPVRPKQEDFDDWPKFQAAEDKYLEDLADWKASERIEKARQKDSQDAQTREMQTRLDEAKSRYGDEAEPKIIDTAKTVFDDQAVAPAIKAAVGRSDVMVDALYVMGSDAKELSAFVNLAKKDPLEALRKWFTIEALVKEELGKAGKTEKTETSETREIPERGPNGQFLPERRTRSAPPPTVELNGNASPAGDDSARAAESGNFRAFKGDRDRKDLLRLQGR